MKDWKEFNEMKNEGWKTKTQEEYTNWQGKIKEWYKNQTELTDWDKDQIKVQLQKINENKEEYFKKKPKVFTPKVTYLLQDDLAKALTEYIKLKTIELSMELEAKKSILDEKNYK